MNKLISLIAILALLALSTASYSQTTLANNLSAPSLESDYQEELDKWMLQAYEGDREAQFKVGVLFTNDQFQSADMEQAVYWYKQAARQGHALAQYNLGHQYLTGTGVKRSEPEAMKWWLKAAEQDHPLAQFNLGRAYYLGIGLDQDHDQSRLWFKRAAKNNEPKSIDILKQLKWYESGDFKAVVVQQPRATEQAVRVSPEPISEPTPISEPELALETEPTQSSSPEQPEEAFSNEPIANSADSQADAAQVKLDKAAQVLKMDSKNPIAVYTDPAKRSVLIAIIDIRDQLSVTNSGPKWTQVTNQNGFPVWVQENYLDVSNKIGTVKGNAVNARSVPLITNGTVVGRLNNGETLLVLDKKNSWYRVMSPSRFKAWVKTDEFKRSKTPATKPATSQLEDDDKTQINAVKIRLVSDDQWLFSQPADGYTLQLASFDDPQKVAMFTSRKKFLDNPELHSFTSTSRDINWTYFLYGEFSSKESAIKTRTEIDQKKAWIRSFGKLQQNRCLAWKKQIPTPKELNKYCS